MRKITPEQVEEAISQFCPFGYRDIEKAMQTIIDATGENFPNDSVYAICNDYLESTDSKLENIDPVYAVYEYYYQIARTDIENATKKDICNDKPYQEINIHGNYMCTSFDGSEENNAELHKLIDTIPEEKQTPAIKWLRSETEY